MKEYPHEFAEHVYLTPDEWEKQGGIWPLRMGINEAKPNYQVGPKSIECYSIHILLEGDLLFHYRENNVEHLSQGDLFCMFPNHTYSYGLGKPTDSLRMLWIAFQGSQADHLLDTIGVHSLCPFIRNKNRAARTNLQQHLHPLIEFCKNGIYKDMHHALELQISLYKVFQYFLPALTTTHHQKSTSPHWLERCLAFMKLHYTENISIQDVADFVGIHRSYFSDAFTKSIGISPVQYLQNLRMDKAKSLLISSQHSITEIAYSLGYSSLYTFSRAFRNHWGLYPSKFSKSIKTLS